MEEHFQHLINLHITTLERTLYALNDYLGSGSPTIIFQNKITIDNHISGIGRSIHQLTRDISKISKNNIKSNNRINNNIDINYSLPVDTYLNNINKVTNNNNNNRINITRNIKLKNPMKHTKLNTIERWQILCLDDDNVDFLWNAFIKFDVCYDKCKLYKAFILWKNTIIKSSIYNNTNVIDDTIRISPNNMITNMSKYDYKQLKIDTSPPSLTDDETLDYRKYLQQVDLKLSKGLRNIDTYDDMNYMSKGQDYYMSSSGSSSYMNHELKEDEDSTFRNDKLYGNDDDDDDDDDDDYNEYEYTNSRRSSWDNEYERSFSPEVFDAGSGQQIFSLESDNMISSIEDYINLNPIGSSSSIDKYDDDNDDDRDFISRTTNKSYSNSSSQNFANLQTLKHQLFKYNRNELLDPLDSMHEAFEIS